MKRVTKTLLLIGLAVSLVGCNKAVEVNKEKDYKIGKEAAKDYMDDFKIDIIKLYNPKDEMEYKKVVDSITKRMTTACANSFKSNTGEYVKEEAIKSRVVKILKAEFGSKDWQEDKKDRLLYSINIKENNTKEYNLNLEFILGEDGKIQSYDIW